MEPVQVENEADEDVDDGNESDDDFIVFENAPTTRNNMSLRNLAKECDRWGVSNRAGAAIANTALIDAGVITPQDQTSVIDKSKLRRALASYRKERQVEDIKILEENKVLLTILMGRRQCHCVLRRMIMGKSITPTGSWS